MVRASVVMRLYRTGGCSGVAAIYGHFERVCQKKNKGKRRTTCQSFSMRGSEERVRI